MKVFLRQIPESGMSFEETVPLEELDIPADVCDRVSDLAVHGDMERLGDEVVMKFEVRGKYGMTCSRCLEDYETERTDRFELVFDVEPSTEFIEYTNEFRDELILAFPFNPHCREDCQGLCPHCGVNLNKGKCKCNTSCKLQDTGDRK